MHRTPQWYLSLSPHITYNMYIHSMLHIFAYKYLQNYIWYVMYNTYTHLLFVYVFKETERTGSY